METIKLLIAHPTRKGPVFIGASQDGRFHPIWGGQDLGSYHTAQAAVEDVSGGHTFMPSDGTDLGLLGISDDAEDWLPAADFV